VLFKAKIRTFGGGKGIREIEDLEEMRNMDDAWERRIFSNKLDSQAVVKVTLV